MKAKTVFIGAFALAAALLLPWAVQAEEVVKLGGNGTGLEVMKALIPAFEREHPGVKVVAMKSLGSSGGIKALIGGAIDIALSSRPVKENERQQGAETLFSARSPFILMANNSVRKTDLSAAEVASIYGGKVHKWPDGSDIKLVLRPEGDTDTKTLQEISPEVSAAVAGALHRTGMLVALTDEDSDRYISRIAGALGTSSLAQVAAERLSCRILSFNGVKPSISALANGKYPLVKDILVVANRGRLTPATRRFIDFVRSAKGMALLRKMDVLAEKTQTGK